MSLTGKGHHPDTIITGRQETVRRMLSLMRSRIYRVSNAQRAAASGIWCAYCYFPVAKNIIFHPEMLPRHENGMRITAWKGQEELLSKNVFTLSAAGYCRRRTLWPVARCRNVRTLRFPLSR
ncbi:serine dehydratase beta chain [Shigella flexneri]